MLLFASICAVFYLFPRPRVVAAVAYEPSTKRVKLNIFQAFFHMYCNKTLLFTMFCARGSATCRPISGGFSHMQAAPPYPAETEKKIDFWMVKTIRRHPPRKNWKKEQNWHFLPKIAERKRCIFQCFCNFCVWNWNMKILYVEIYLFRIWTSHSFT